MDVMLFGGCEGGASHSNMVIANENGEIVADVHGEGTNQWLIGMDECIRRIADMVQRCKEAAGIPTSISLQSLGLSLSGVDSIQNQKDVSDAVASKHPLLTNHCFACNDTLSPLTSVTDGGGVVLIAGTGSNCLLVNSINSETTNCGGWGHLLGDQGSAHWIVMKALKTIYQDMDGFKSSLYSTEFLKKAMFDYFKMKSVYDILPHLYPKDAKAIDKFLIAKFCLEGVYKGAELGDKLCLHLFECAGAKLGNHVKALIPKMSAELLIPPGGLKIVCIGSVWKSWTYLKEGFLKGLLPQTDEEKQLKEFCLLRLKGKVSLGAAAWAAKKAGLNFHIDYTKMSELFFAHKF